MEVRAGDCGPIDLQTRISKGADVSHRHAEISVSKGAADVSHRHAEISV